MIYKNEVQQKSIVSDFENIPSNCSGLMESRLLGIKDGKRCGNEYEGEDAHVSDNESKLERNETNEAKQWIQDC